MAHNDLSALGWVKKELDVTLKQAQQSLEAYVADPDDETQLRFCATYLHQVYGTLQVLELYGAGLLAEEMEQLVQSLLSGGVARKEDAYDVLMRCMLQLPDYLDRLQSGEKDIPIVLMPLLNDLRSARGLKLISENAFFSPDLGREAPEITATDESREKDLQEVAKKLRPVFQVSLLGWLRDEEVDANLKRLLDVLQHLYEASSEEEARRLWWISEAVVDATRSGLLDTSVTTKVLIGQVDRQIKKVIDQGEAQAASDLDQALVKNLLYYVAQATGSEGIVGRVKQIYDLEGLLPDEGEVKAAQQSLTGSNVALIDSVSSAVREDLARVKDALEHLIHDESKDPGRLEPALDDLRRVGDTLGMLGMGVARKVVQEQISLLGEIVSGELAADDAGLMEMASALLYVESALSNFGQDAPGEDDKAESVLAGLRKIKSGEVAENEHAIKQSELSGSEFKNVIGAAIHEAIVDMAHVKEIVSEFVASPYDQEPLEKLPELFTRVRGSLQMLDLKLAASIVSNISAYINETLIESGEIPEESDLEHFANVVSSAEYYLEQIRDTGVDNTNYLKVAIESLAALGLEVGDGDIVAVAASEPVTASEEAESVAPAIEETVVEDKQNIEDESKSKHPEEEAETLEQTASEITKAVAAREELPVLTEQVDDEILEIFIEEAQEELVSIQEHFPRWKNNNQDMDALGTVRRSFHTLKGSGRLVGAMRIGEFAWAFENMLNRVMDETIQTTSAIFNLMDVALEALPELVGQLTGGPEPTRNINALVEVAERMSKGETSLNIQDVIAASEQQVKAPHAEEVAEPEDTVQQTEHEQMMDPVLYEIFSKESETHIITIEEFINACKSDNESCYVTHALTRALHTLHGSARMANEKNIGEISGTMEKLVKLYEEQEEPVPGEVINMLVEAKDSARNILSLLCQPGADIPDQSELVEKILSAKDDFSRIVEERRSDARANRIAESMVASAQQSEPGENELEQVEEVDEELIEIFLEEGDEILAATDEALQGWKNQLDNQDIVKELQRQLHTLKGGARMAGIMAVGDLAHSMESLFQSIAEGQSSINEKGFSEVQTGNDRLYKMLDEVRNHKAVTPADDLVARIQSLSSGASEEIEEEVQVQPEATAFIPSAPVQEESYEEEDAGEADDELIDIFLEEGEEILDSLDDVMSQWSDSPASKEPVQELQRHLHTIKGGARMAGIVPIGDLSHRLESLFEAIVAGQIEASSALQQTVQSAFDRLHSMLGEVRKRQAVTPENDLVARFDQYLGGEVPAADVHAEHAQQIHAEEEAVDQEVAATVEEFIEITDGVLESVPEEATASSRGQEVIRVSADLLDSLVNYAGEVSIYRARLDQEIGAYRFNLDELGQTVMRVREQMRRLDIETESQILHSYEQMGHTHAEDFDPLEMDQYSTLQQLSRALSESINDLGSIQGMMENITSQAEVLLLQQSRVNTDLQEGLMRTRMIPFSSSVPRFRRLVRQTGDELSKPASLRVVGAEGEMDRTILERITAPLEHMLRNAIAHGLEDVEERKKAGKDKEGKILLRLLREGSEVIIQIQDDGRGISVDKVKQKAVERGLLKEGTAISDEDALQFILESGFSTASEVTQVAGRGVGMDVVHSEVKQLGGSLHIESRAGKGTTFTIRLPFTLSVTQALLVSVLEETYALPLTSVQGVVRMGHAELQKLYSMDEPSFEYAGFKYNVQHLGTTLGLCHEPHLPAKGEKAPVLLVRVGDHHIAYHVESLMGSREIVVKSLGIQLSTVRGMSGATILGDGSVILILDINALVRSSAAIVAQPDIPGTEQPVAVQKQPLVMVVDDSITVRKVTTRALQRNDFDVITAKDGVEAVAMLQEQIPDIMLLDIEMPRMDGYEVATHVRNDERFRHIPIIMITSRTGEKHRQKAMEIGVNQYLGKPFQEAVLVDEIRTQLEKAGQPIHQDS